MSEERLSAAMITISNGVGVNKFGDPRKIADHILDKFEALETRISELTNSEEKAWQTVAKLRVELETTDRLRMENINLKLELAGEKRALETSERNASYNFEERVRLESLLEEHGVKPGPDIRIGTHQSKDTP